MAKLPDDDRILKLIRQSKNEPVNFAFGLGKTPDKHILSLHKTKAGKSMSNDIKKQGEDIGKVAYGTLQLDGKDLTIKCEKEAAGLERAVKKYLKEKGLKFKADIGE
jgi:hypothetical protein